MKNRYVFPFAATLGQEQLKKALLLNVINPAIGGVIISGEKGTAKSTLVRGLAKVISDIEVVELPLNVTEDRLLGTINFEKAVKEGARAFEPGILKKVDGNILYVDEINLLSEYIVNCLLEVSASHINRVEREGISYCHESKFILIGTMNPEEGLLKPHF
ncbi:AAA domain (dynein-related subfamily) [Geosporobacter subterraneus DSM 17957]|uniref:AAA domain (Dynein-related subfamily) n=1 Tax=Geosporobacter subterraneus DSM 17957 TaxID=1121919 RepID=A0A1M6Q572_9FIRM|nr:AAA family ATPase [Geosporobacter subterraneus]SHK15419.1 AAA domain (dynein-related subfamily) [Geosporobacter subterraneus DSM 17957]